MAKPLPPFQAFLDEHRGPVLAFLRSMVGPDDADDCFQETFIVSDARLRHPRRPAPAGLGDDDRPAQGDRPPPGPRPAPGAARASCPSRHATDGIPGAGGRRRRALGARRRAAAEAARGGGAALRRRPRVRGRGPRPSMLARRRRAAASTRGSSACARTRRSSGRRHERRRHDDSSARCAPAPRAPADEADARGAAAARCAEPTTRGSSRSPTPPSTRRSARCWSRPRERGLVRVGRSRARTSTRVLERLAAGRLAAPAGAARAASTSARRELDEYFDGGRREFDLRLDWRLIHGDFTGSVLENVERGSVRARPSPTAEAAERAGSPRASPRGRQRARLEPDPGRVPCHRVSAPATCSGGYGGGPGDEALPARARGLAATETLTCYSLACAKVPSYVKWN